MQDVDNVKKLQDLYCSLKQTQYWSRKKDNGDAAKAVDNIHFKTLIEFLDATLNAYTDKNDEYAKVLSMKVSLMYEQSKILISLNKFQASTELLQHVLSAIQDFKNHPQMAFVHMRLVNHLAYLLSKYGLFEESKKILEAICDRCDFSHVLIYNTDDLFANKDVDQSEAKSKISKLVGNNLQMLAWVYGKLGKSDVHASKLHLSLRKQLEVTDFNPLDWTYKCIRLAALYLASCNWSSACYHLVAAEVVLKNHACASTSRAWGDLARTWTNYGLHLFGNSKIVLTNSENLNTIETITPKEQDLLFLGLEINISGIPTKIVRNSAEAHCLFLHTQGWLNKAKDYYNLDDFPIYYVNTILDLSELLRFSASYEPDLDSQYNVHKRRADSLEIVRKVLKEVRPQCYAAVSVKLLKELSEVQIEMMDINLRRLSMSCDDAGGDRGNGSKKRILTLTNIPMKLDGGVQAVGENVFKEGE